MIEQLRSQYSGLYKKNVPNNKKNDQDWIAQKIAEKLDNRETNPVEAAEPVQKTPVKKEKPKLFKILFNGRDYQLVHLPTRKVKTFQTLQEAQTYSKRYES